MHCLGIDVDKQKLHCCLIYGTRHLHKVFKNAPDGFEKLSEWLQKYETGAVHACMESTGSYSERIADYLHDTGHKVSIVNPLSIKKYADQQLLNVKTDKQDAKTIAYYCKTNQPPAYVPPSHGERKLKALTRQLDYYKDMLTAQLNRQQVAHDATRPLIDDTVGHLHEQIRLTEDLIQSHIESDPALKEKAALLKTVRGIGKATIPHLLTLFAERKFKTAKQLTKYVGLNPIIRQSGGSKAYYPAISKMGDKHVRCSLYMPAVLAHRLPEYRPFIDRLKAAGKTGKQICCALMRKILTYCYTVLRTGKPFDPSFTAPRTV